MCTQEEENKKKDKKRKSDIDSNNIKISNIY